MACTKTVHIANNEEQNDTETLERKKGFQFGFSGQRIRWFQYRYYSEQFLSGYIAGRDLLEQLVDDAVIRNMY